jgi:hypothetical protein
MHRSTGKWGVAFIVIAALCGACGKRPQAEASAAPVDAPRTGERDGATERQASASTQEAPSIADAAVASSQTPQPNTAQPTSASASTPPEPPEALMANYMSEDGPTSPMMPSRQYHAAFGAEKRDDAWADYVEAKLREYFARQRDTGHFAIVSLGCRSTLCEVLVVNRSPEATPGDVTRWQEIVFGLKRERWYPSAGIAEPSMEFGSSQDGRAMIVTYLLRA